MAKTALFHKPMEDKLATHLDTTTDEFFADPLEESKTQEDTLPSLVPSSTTSLVTISYPAAQPINHSFTLYSDQLECLGDTSKKAKLKFGIEYDNVALDRRA